MPPRKPLQKKQNPPGLVPCKEVDFLEQDPPIRGQAYACISFISPEDVIAKREAFYFTRFVAAVAKDIDNLLEGVLDKFGQKGSGEDLHDPRSVKATVAKLRERYEYLSSPEVMTSEFDFFSVKMKRELEEEFARSVNGATSIRGVKIRGTYETLVEAQHRATALLKTDPKHNVFVAAVGCWCPWSPNLEDMADCEYGETALNTLMKGYQDNLRLRDEVYSARRTELLEAIEKDVGLRGSGGGSGGSGGSGTVHIRELGQVVEVTRTEEEEDGKGGGNETEETNQR
jgi:hypothetical protein